MPIPLRLSSLSPFRFGGLLLLIFLLTVDLSALAQGGERGGNGGRGRGGDRPKIGQVFGKVRDAETGKAIEFATIAVLSPSDSSIVGGGVTDSNGRFDIRELPVGRHMARVMFMGYHDEIIGDIRLNPKGGTTQDLGTIHLQPNVQALEAAEVVAQQSSLELLIDRKVFHVGNDLNAVGSTATELLKNVPSVDVDIDGSISLRGSSNVTILIDGRPSGLTGSSSEGLLSQIPSSTIDRIEIITNPSAKFDPEGMAGILNIILKKDKLRGMNGQLAVTAGTGGNHSGSVNGNWRGSKFNLTGNIGANLRDGLRTSTSERDQWFGIGGDLAPDSSSHLSTTSNSDNLRAGLSGRVGLDYMHTPFTTWNIGYRGNISDNSGLGNTANLELWDIALAPNQIVNQFTASNKASESISNTYDAGYERKFGSDRHVLRMTARLSQSQGISEDSVFIQTFMGPLEDSLNIPSEYDFPHSAELLSNINSKDTEGSNLNLQIDYERPLANDGKLELGMRSTVRSSREEFTYAPGLDPGFGTAFQDFKYSEDIHAAYGTWGRKFGAVGLQLGGRFEQVFTQAELKGADGTAIRDSLFNNDYFSFYPSVNMNYTVDDRNQWQISFSRRVNRPRGRQVNPYVDNSNPRSIRIGNPYLRPEYTQSVEVNHQLTSRAITLTSGLFYKHTTDVIRRYRTTDSLGVSTSTFENIASQKNYGAEMVGMWRPSDRFSFRGNASIYVERADGSNLEADLGSEGVRISLGYQATTLLRKDYKVQINGRFMAPSAHLQGTFEGYFTNDIAVSRDLYDGKLRCSIRVSDLFNTRQWAYTSEGENFILDSTHKRESRFLYLSASWNFGKMDAGGRGKRGSRGGESPSDGGGGMEF